MYQQRKEEKKLEKAQRREEKRSRKLADTLPMTEEERAAKREAQKQRSRQRIDHVKAVAKRLQDAESDAPKLVLDLDFWDLMADGYRRSLVSQVAFSAGCNKKSVKPCSIHLTRWVTHGRNHVVSFVWSHACYVCSGYAPCSTL